MLSSLFLPNLTSITSYYNLIDSIHHQFAFPLNFYHEPEL